MREPARHFDQIYREKHDLAESKLIERLKNALTTIGTVVVSKELRKNLGTYDILISQNNPLKIIPKVGCQVIVEMKTGLSLSLTQLERYFEPGSVLFVIRIATQQVIRLEASKYEKMLSASTLDLAEKLKRILKDKAIIVPGLHCSGCPVQDCQYYVPHSSSTILRTPRDIQEELDQFLMNLYPTIQTAVKKIVRELAASTCTNVSSASSPRFRQETLDLPVAQPDDSSSGHPDSSPQPPIPLASQSHLARFGKDIASPGTSQKVWQGTASQHYGLQLYGPTPVSRPCRITVNHYMAPKGSNQHFVETAPTTHIQSSEEKRLRLLQLDAITKMKPTVPQCPSNGRVRVI